MPAQSSRRDRQTNSGDFGGNYWASVYTLRGESQATVDVWGFDDSIYRILADLKPHNVLEVGCGDASARPIVLQFPETSYLGVDPSRAGLLRALTLNTPERSELIVGDGGALPFKNGTADLLLMVGALHHGGWGLIEEARRALRKDGTLVIIDHSVKDSLIARAIFRMARGVPLFLRGRPGLNTCFLDGQIPETLLYSKRDLELAMTRTGFGALSWEYSTTGAAFLFQTLLLLGRGFYSRLTPLLTRASLKTRSLSRPRPGSYHARRCLNFLVMARLGDESGRVGTSPSV